MASYFSNYLLLTILGDIIHKKILCIVFYFYNIYSIIAKISTMKFYRKIIPTF